MRKIRLLLGVILTAALIFGLCSQDVLAAKKQKEKKDEHPVAVIKATVDRNSFDNETTGVKRTCTLWVKNLSRETQKDIKVNIKIYDNKRELEDLDKTIEELDPGAREFVHFKWDDYSRSHKQRIRIWLTYTNDEGKEVTFEAPTPVW